MCDKVNDGDKLASVGINECLNPSIGGIILDLNDVGEDCSAVGLGEVLQGNGEIVVFALESCLSLGNSFLSSELGCRRGDGFCKRTVVSKLNCHQGVSYWA